MAANDLHDAGLTGDAGTVRAWTLPAFDGPPTAASIERVEQHAWQEGEARGYAEGLQRGAATVAQRVAALDAILQSLAQPLAHQDEALSRELQQLAWVIGEQLARSQLRHDADAVARLVHEAIATLAVPAQTLTVQVPAAQLQAVREALEQAPPAGRWQIEANVTLAPGDCRVCGLHATADATLEARVRSLAERYLEVPQDVDVPR